MAIKQTIGPAGTAGRSAGEGISPATTNSVGLRLTTAITPMIWGTTYIVTSELLPEGRPFHAAFSRAAIAGVVLAAITRTKPPPGWWWRSLVLGTLNIGAFFVFLFVAAYRLPGGVAATVGAISPLVVALLAAMLLAEPITRNIVVAGSLGAMGVALLVLRGDVAFDLIGLLAAFAGTLSMATGIVLTKRWRPPGGPLVATSWQLIAGAAVLAPLAVLVDGTPRGLSAVDIGGYLWLALAGGAVAYALWFRGLERLPASHVSLLALMSPVVATTLGIVVNDEALTGAQAVGIMLVLVAVLIGQRSSKPKPLSGRRRRN